MVEPLLAFFLPKVKELDLLDGAHPGSSTVLTFYEQYKNGVLIRKSFLWISTLLYPFLILQNSNATHLAFKIRDLLCTVGYGLSLKTKYDLFIGLESVYALAGILLKKIGKVKKVVYYVSDYSPKRYPNRLINGIYLWLDRFCCYHADYIWDVSKVIMPTRIRSGLNAKKSAPLILVPNALFDEQISYLPREKRQPNSLVFLGTLGPENGPQVAIDAMSLILKKIPKACLHIIGGGDDFEEPLKRRVARLKLEDSVVFHGFISNAVEVSKLARNFMVGLAPYTALPDSPRWFADATKIRLYMGIALPVITTYVSPLGKDVAEKGSAVIVGDNERELAEAIVAILQDRNYMTKCAKPRFRMQKTILGRILTETQ